jgi:predicted DsbA family dithiol-disulfide isomerase
MSQPGTTAESAATAREPVVFYLDPICPWTWRASLWLREVRQVRPVEIEWRFFSLDKNREGEWIEGRSGVALRTLALARRQGGPEAVDRLYLALGEARHERKEELRDPSVVDAAVAAAGLPPDLRAKAVADPSTREEIEAEHEAVVEQRKAFGVPVIVLDGGEGPHVWGPVINAVPRGEDAVQFWDRVVWLVRRPDFFELKRPR